MEEATQNMAEALKGIKTDEFKHCFEPCGKRLDGRLASDGEL